MVCLISTWTGRGHQVLETVMIAIIHDAGQFSIFGFTKNGFHDIPYWFMVAKSAEKMKKLALFNRNET